MDVSHTELHSIPRTVRKINLTDGGKFVKKTFLSFTQHLYYDKDHKLHRIDGNAKEVFDNRSMLPNHICRSEKWIHGKLHGEPAVIHYELDGRVIKEEYWKNGILHRDNEPAIMYKNLYGIVINEFYNNRKRHNNKSPAYIEINPIMNLKCCKFYQNGKLHNENAPALTRHTLYKNELLDEEWRINGVLHRKDGYAHTSIRSFMDYAIFYHYVDGKIHHDNKPAIVELELSTKKIINEKHYINGIKQGDRDLVLSN